MKYVEIPGARHLRARDAWVADSRPRTHAPVDSTLVAVVERPSRVDPAPAPRAAEAPAEPTAVAAGPAGLAPWVARAPSPERQRRKRRVAALLVAGTVAAIPLLGLGLFLLNR
ncbi:hypothetical protein ACQ7DA_07730 [Zafaria sp. J156]|uniref:hypothetical protein n=1 Tax=Zafaria sp. J156 TaxID=3116490 RepID=UPI002E79473E|nr:hypothetical protein [Zafaria sp. J156]MEE1620739.1 hypothetical protein [Zafaria sp. J156]